LLLIPTKAAAADRRGKLLSDRLQAAMENPEKYLISGDYQSRSGSGTG